MQKYRDAKSSVLVSKMEGTRITGYSYSTIKRLVQSGVLEEVRVAPGMHPRLRLDDLLALGAKDRDDRPA